MTLREEYLELLAERDALRARVAELEADAAKAREILASIWLPNQAMCDWMNKYDAALVTHAEGRG